MGALINCSEELRMYNPTIQAICSALKPIERIPRPEGDNDGDPINSDTVYPYLSIAHQQQVRYAEELLYDYTRTSDGQPNRRAINTLIRQARGPQTYRPL
jgi:hypothetical protein